MLQFNDLVPNALRYEGLTTPEVETLLTATAGIVPREGPGQVVPPAAPGAEAAVRAGRVTWGPSFVTFDDLSPDEVQRIADVVRGLGRPPGQG